MKVVNIDTEALKSSFEQLLEGYMYNDYPILVKSNTFINFRVFELKQLNDDSECFDGRDVIIWDDYDLPEAIQVFSEAVISLCGE